MFFALFKKTTLQNFNIKLQRAVSKPQSPVNKTFRLQRFLYKPPDASFEITKSNSRITWGGSFVSKPNRLTISWWLGFVVLYPLSQETWLPLDQNKSKHRGPILQKSLPSLSQNHGLRNFMSAVPGNMTASRPTQLKTPMPNPPEVASLT